MNSRIQLSDGENDGLLSHHIALSDIEFSDDTNSSWIQALPMGTYKHPIYGNLKFDDKKLAGFEETFRANVRQQDLDIDFDHKQFRSEAAGWVKDLRVDTTNIEESKRGLWLHVEWTTPGIEGIKGKTYKYFSADFFDKWVHPGNNKTYKNVLNGGALTNRPFLKGIQQVTLSEDERGTMNREALEALARSLGVAFDESTTDEALQAAVEAKAVEASNDDDSSGEDADTDVNEDTTEDSDDAELVSSALSEDPAFKRLLAENRQAKESIRRLEAANRLSETNRQLSSLKSDKGNVVLTPVATDQLKAIMLSSDDTTAKSVFDLVKTILNDGVRELGERGRANAGGSDFDTSTISEFERLATKLSEDEKIPYIDALDRISTTRPELYTAYMQASYGGGN